MLAAPQAETLVTDFALRWLDLLEVNKFEWDKQIFPEFSAELRQDFSTEIDLLPAQHPARRQERGAAVNGRLYLPQ